MTNTIFNHRSIRKYKMDEIPSEILNNILNAGTRASTTGNMQVYSMIVTHDETIRKQLWEAHFKQDMVLQAPVHITFCADFHRFTKWCELRDAKPGYDNFLSFITGAVDAVLASQNVVLQAEEKGLGACYLGTATYNADKIIQILNLPKLVVPVAAIVLGYPDENPGITERLPLDAVVHHNVYKDFNEEKINRIYAERDSSRETLELLEINQKETLAQIFTDNRYTKENNVLFSRKYIDVIKKQGFMNQ